MVVGGVAVRQRVRVSTPTLLRLGAALLAAGLVALGAVAAVSSIVRDRAVHRLEGDATPLLLDTEHLYVALADADAASSTAFLTAGLEPPELRQRYLHDIDTAGRRLATIAAHRGLSASGRQALQTLSAKLPLYAGEVEAARANNRQGFPVGAAYLRHASQIMRDDLLPAATTLHEDAAARLDAGYRSGTARSHVVALVALAAVSLLGGLVVQLFLAGRTRRVFNVGLVAATVALVATTIYGLVVFAGSQHALAASEREGSDPVQVLSVGRILALRSLSDENLDLIQRGTDTSYITDFNGTVQRLGLSGRGGLMALARDVEQRAGRPSQVALLGLQLHTYQHLHGTVRSLDDDQGDYKDAVTLAVGDEASALAAADDSFAREIDFAAQRLDVHASHASRLLTPAPYVLAIGAALAALVAVLGLRRRITEYTS
jgi:hypothetical protein